MMLKDNIILKHIKLHVNSLYCITELTHEIL